MNVTGVPWHYSDPIELFPTVLARKLNAIVSRLSFKYGSPGREYCPKRWKRATITRVLTIPPQAKAQRFAWCAYCAARAINSHMDFLSGCYCKREAKRRD